MTQEALMPQTELRVSDIVAADIRKAEIFKKHGIEFCCGGKKTLTQACLDVNADLAEVKADLEKSNTQPSIGPFLDYINWDASFLADYIVNQHHKFYYRTAPLILELSHKVAAKHGAQNVVYKILASKFQELHEDLVKHFATEENVIFPYIKRVTEKREPKDFDEISMADMIANMEADHQQAGSILAEIKELTNNFTPAAGCCNSVALLFSKLSEVDQDLKRHIHLENNILFPKFIAYWKNAIQPVI